MRVVVVAVEVRALNGELVLVQPQHGVVLGVAPGEGATHALALDHLPPLLVVAEVVVLYHVLYQLVLVQLLGTQNYLRLLLKLMWSLSFLSFLGWREFLSGCLLELLVVDSLEIGGVELFKYALSLQAVLPRLISAVLVKARLQRVVDVV